MSEVLFVRLYLDHHIPKQLQTDLRKMGFDVLTTAEEEMETAPDDEQLAFATSSGRAVFTFNIRDYALLHQKGLAQKQDHAGIIVSRQIEPKKYGLLLQRIVRLLNHFTQDELRNNLVHLEQFK